MFALGVGLRQTRTCKTHVATFRLVAAFLHPLVIDSVLGRQPQSAITQQFILQSQTLAQPSRLPLLLAFWWTQLLVLTTKTLLLDAAFVLQSWRQKWRQAFWAYRASTPARLAAGAWHPLCRRQVWWQGLRGRSKNKALVPHTLSC